MITNVQILDNQLSWDGQPEVGDIYNGYCCPGYKWEVELIFPDDNPGYVSLYGCCYNPDCPDWNGEEFDPYRGVSHICAEDLATQLADGTSRHRFMMVDTWDDPAKTADFFTGPPMTGDPYEAFGEWAVEHGYDVNDDAQFNAALEAYGGEK